VARTLQQADEPLGAVEVAELAGLSRVTARRYLEHLVLANDAALELRYGTGRPEHRYRWSDR
ncbi:MAG TPA: helix-turn-helix domain-containing protein, partial [Solirubrobacter sp.]|nr:helix-turn-helix domain-containing protein [Solirubrobacter sp.]